MSTHQGLTITELQQAVTRVDGMYECDSCGRYLPLKYRRGLDSEDNYFKSDVLPDSKFCSESCRNEAELAAEDARRSDGVQR